MRDAAGLLLLRLAAGGLLLPHGLALLQVLAGVLLVLGVWTRAAALAATGFLAVTAVLAVPNGWFWMSRGVEYPLLWTWACLVIAMLGPGAWALDPPRAAATAGRGHA